MVFGLVISEHRFAHIRRAGYLLPTRFLRQAMVALDDLLRCVTSYAPGEPFFSTLPGNEPVRTPSSITGVPLTIT